MRRAPSSAMVLSFARGRARHVARELVDLEFRLDVELLTVHGAMRLLRPAQHELLRREIDRRVQLLATHLPEIDPRDALAALIERACATYAARGTGPRDDAEVAWALALHALETACGPR